ncbi:MAG: adenine deaminase, partial [Vulcanisaeta sp.]
DVELIFPQNVLADYVNSLHELLNVVRGLKRPDLVIRDVNIVDVVSGRVVEGMTIVVYSKFIVALVRSSNDDKYSRPNVEVINGRGAYAVPGFIDAHVHIESSFLSPGEFARLALVHGTTLVVADPHDITNVGGLNYLIEFVKSAQGLPLKVLVQVPPCIPPTKLPVDNPGVVLTAEDLRHLVDTGLFHSLGEFMDFKSIVEGDDDALARIRIALERGLMIYGHIPTSDEDCLNAYTVVGPSSCHESTTMDEVLGKLLRGMWVMLRLGTAWKDAEYLLPGLIRNNVSLNRLVLVTDDISVTDLVENGYMDYAVRRVIEYGVDPIDAIRLVTVNPATYLKLDNLIGMVAPGRVADIVLLNNLRDISIKTVIVNGRLIYHNGQLIINRLSTGEGGYRYLTKIPFKTPSIGNWSELAIRVGRSSGKASVLALGIQYGIPVTKRVVVEVPIRNGLLMPSPNDDISSVVVIDRYRGTYIGKGFVHGLGLRDGSIAQTIGRDTHNILVLGTDFGDMLTALRELEALRGGIVVVRGGEVRCRVRLELGGLMSVRSYEEVYEDIKCIEKFLSEGGVTKPNMTLFHISLIPVVAIPEIRITPLGVVDVNNMRIVNPVLALNG